MRSLIKDTFREIKRTKSRFFSIFAIVALGAGFFAGIKATGPDMKITADNYYRDYSLMDIKLMSTFGFDEDDVSEIQKNEQLDQIMPGYSTDAFVSLDKESYVVKVYGMPFDKLNQPVLVEGRLPEKSGECVVEKGFGEWSVGNIGDKISLFLDDPEKPLSEKMSTTEFEIVGLVESPMYISFERGSSSLGSGKVTIFIMVPDEDFCMEYYSEVYATIRNDVNCFEDEYADLVENLIIELETVGKLRSTVRYDDIMQEAQTELDDARKELKDGEEKGAKELADARIEISDAKKELDNANIELSDGERELSDAKKEYNEKIADAEKQLSDAHKELQDGEKKYRDGLKKYERAKEKADEELTEGSSILHEAKIKYIEEKNKVDQMNSLGLLTPEMAAGYYYALEEARKEISKNESFIYEAELKLEDARIELESARIELEDAKTTLEEEEERFEREKADARQKIDDAEVEIADGRVKYKDGVQKLQDAEKDYAEGKEEYETEIDDAQEKIDDAQKEINDIEEPEWYVNDRSVNPQYSEFKGDAEKIDAISQVFPVFFILVAGLVCLTTMTRMIEEERTQIGTLKALGYSKSVIAGKYLFYAGLASASGAIIGVAIGFQLFPKVIFNAYGMRYTMPPIQAIFRMDYAFYSTIVAVVCTMAAAWFASYNELLSVPANLMRPKAPKSGKRVLLERIGFIWSRLSFSQKVTIRNLLRYKKRIFMTVIGIAGCTGLMLTGFGVKDSVTLIGAKQFSTIFKYDATIAIDDKSTDNQQEKLKNEISAYEHIYVYQSEVDMGKEKHRKKVNVVVPDSVDNFGTFITLQTRKTENPVSITNDGAVISEKLAKVMNLKVGDTALIMLNDKEVDIKISGIVENYTFHYVYMSKEYFENTVGEALKLNSVLLNYDDDVVLEDFAENILQFDSVLRIIFSSDSSTTFLDMVDSLNYVILVLICSAGALAFVVLYNLSNININERIREIATIKVLGFYDKEVSSYIYRENVILTIVGIFFGFGAGIALHAFVIQTAEIDAVMFGREIEPLSYLMAGIMTIVFALIVNIVMHFFLKKISMVESLKSIE